MEEKTEVRTFKVNYKCDDCDDGYLKHTGTVLTSYPAQYPHKCTNCDYTETFRGISYPYTATETK